MKNYEITEEQIKELAKGNAKVKKWFPKVFETKLEVGKWYKVKRDLKNELEAIVFFEGVDKVSFGFSHGGKWVTDYGTPNDTFCNKNYTYTLAPDSEVLEALINEAKKRGFKDGVCFNIVNGEREPIHIDKNARYIFDIYGNKLLMNNWCIFEKGIWATPIKTYTKEEAEKMLNAKII